MSNIERPLCRLLAFTANIGVAIRMHTPYAGADATDPTHAWDVLWMADAIHNLDRLSSAIESGSPDHIQHACVSLISIYEDYRKVTTGKAVEPKDTFERNAPYVDLDDAIAALREILGALVGGVGANS